MSETLNQEQSQALEYLQSGENVFLSGGAGSGKSYLIRHFMQDFDRKTFPLLASTGAAAVLIGGRTFHSFFGLGIMEGGPNAALSRGSRDPKTLKRIKDVEGVIIDEISMISKDAFEVAEKLARMARKSEIPWGGLRVICVGDFAQLPPVKADWCFKSLTWKDSNFLNYFLSHNHRVSENNYLNVLANVRVAKMNEEVLDFLNDHTRPHDEDDTGMRLFPRRLQSEEFNKRELDKIRETLVELPSIYIGESKYVEMLKKSSPLPENLKLKIGAQVLFLQNDPQKRWINGTRGQVVDIEPDKIKVKKQGGREVQVDKTQFSMLDAEGNIKATVINFPLILAYATTIHKSQGATLDELWVDLKSLWEPGHAYVALSRLRGSEGLKIISWSPRSIIADPQVIQFYKNLEAPRT